MDQVTTQITIKKKRLTSDQRQAAKALLLETFPQLLKGGQLILHFGPGRNPIFVELQERTDYLTQNLVDSAA